MNILVALHFSRFSRSPIRLRHLPPLTGEGWDRGREICNICDYHKVKHFSRLQYMRKKLGNLDEYDLMVWGK